PCKPTGAAATLSVSNGGKVAIVFTSPSSPGNSDYAYWGLRWAGNHRSELETLAAAGKLSWTNLMPGRPAEIIVMRDSTYVGFSLLRGALFFGVVDRLEAGFDALPKASVVVLDFLEVIYLDSTALESIRRFGETCRARNIEVILFGLGAQPRSLFERTGLDQAFGVEHVVETRRQALDLVIWRSIQQQIQPVNAGHSSTN
ncbi:MAG TPA: sodium-independent anion transporter, partial [Casimicrobium sp.]|nr:sodium-independent anion transporter [Casimicrobium sp.]